MSDAAAAVALTVQAADGRTLEVRTAGPPEGLPLVFHHGTPGGAEFYPPMLTAATRRGLRPVPRRRDARRRRALPGRWPGLAGGHGRRERG